MPSYEKNTHYGEVKFANEDLADILDEIKPLLALHWKEVAHYQDIQLEVDWDLYKNIDKMGCLKIYTAREDDGSLIGYSCFFLRTNPHYKQSLQANQDVIFIHPGKRGFGREFILWCDAQLKSEGVQAVYHHVKVKHNFGPLLEGIGYELVDQIYAKRLDKESL